MFKFNTVCNRGLIVSLGTTCVRIVQKKIRELEADSDLRYYRRDEFEPRLSDGTWRTINYGREEFIFMRGDQVAPRISQDAKGDECFVLDCCSD